MALPSTSSSSPTPGNLYFTYSEWVSGSVTSGRWYTYTADPAALSSSLSVPSPSSGSSMSPEDGGSSGIQFGGRDLQIIIGTCSSVGVLLICLLICCCVRRSRRRASAPQEMRSLEIQGSRPTRRGPNQHRQSMRQANVRVLALDRGLPGSLTTEEVRSAVVIPSMDPYPRFSSSPRTFHQPPSPSSTRWGSDDSEYDMVATDGSSLTRTALSTSDDTVTIRSEGESTFSENPFDHPAYTVQTPHRADPQSLSTRTTSISTTAQLAVRSMNPLIGPERHIHRALPRPLIETSPSSRHLGPMTTSPVTPTTTRPLFSSPTDTFPSSSNQLSPSSIYPSLFPEAPASPPLYETDFHAIQNTGRPDSIITESTGDLTDESGSHGENASGQTRVTTRPRRGTTIIQHADSTRPIGGPSVVVWRDGTRNKEIHLPPSYDQAYGDLSRTSENA